MRSVFDRIQRGDIDLQPDFQRQEVWPLAKKKKLIDTVLREWSIPPVHLVLTETNQLEVLDGQQRLATVRDFLNDQFSIDANIIPLDERLAPLHGRFYSQLDDATKRKIDQYTIRAFRITDYSPDEPNELFYRLNQPTGLTAGEKRNALYSAARKQLKALVINFQRLDNTKETIGFSNARMAYDDVLAKLLFFLDRGTFAVKSTESLISDRFRDPEGFSRAVLSRADMCIGQFSRARMAVGPRRFNKASVLSWLLYCARLDASANAEVAMESFFRVQTSRSGRDYLSDAIAVFADRASLRVSDVSSVAYRDFCLWYLHFFSVSSALPQAFRDQIRKVHETLSERPGVTLEHVLNEALDIAEWSSLQ
ncbi:MULTISPECIES: DUF262 domain-containing protein [Bradyrhizobium]|uniref:DUF262 domain-containing protein n=1 Tax=Bradyrhizobium TaxID=374 RepID=UPI0003F950B4|nr:MULTISPECIES: DUF262 domain-containing protein [Bradyrhizobium]MBR1004865.1 DUF262 domain-containing protein [Bradyrhizobium liaoningense]MCP1746812.1 hypothetical protein [Bradyrhizobium japonicum]MCP1865933.1 hypothetical protein [Bradyrhizobium japonicum]MCP1895299.1 hypothetical protein [Bradyrhizobium japonicum]MCW2328682.1 hypothetical protein [Bradyrhizobium japonicum]